MRRVIALAAAATALAVAGAAYAEHWTKYVDETNGTAWSYDADYSYKDAQTGRLVVMQAISKPSANLGPGAPGKADGIGSVVAVDCSKRNVIPMGSYKPNQPLDIKATWRMDTPKKMDGADDTALLAAVCPHLDHVPVK
jgi:hypothetical protein